MKAALLALMLCGCASTSVYRDGKRILFTQANATHLEFRQGDTSLVIDGMDHSTPTRAGGSVAGTIGASLAAMSAKVLTK